MFRTIVDFFSDSFSIVTHQFSLFGQPKLSLTKKLRHARSRSTSNVDYQAYEPRRLLTSIFFTEATGQVVVGGTTGDDVVRVTQSGGSVTVSHEGSDTQTFANAEVNSILFVGLAGDDFFENRTGISSEAHGQAGNDTLIGGTGNDRLIGNADNDNIVGSGGDDFILAGNGDDRVDAGDGNDRVLGVRGTNTIIGGAGDDLIFGGEGNDSISVTSGDNTLVGFDGNDSIFGGSGVDTIFGGSGNDTLRGFAGNDQIFGQADDDFLSGGGGNDVVNGNDGDDAVQGEQGNDRVIGGAGNDTANYSGDLAEYQLGRSGAFLNVNDLRGSNFSANDSTFAIEQLNFSDGIRTAAEALNPTPTAPSANTREVVRIQPIIASNSDGSNTAEFFGTAQQQADIQNRIDEIFEQANIDIEFLPAVEVNDTFINTGNVTSGQRPSGQLDTIISRGDSIGVGHDDRLVIDLYFVEIVPAFDDVGNGVANGLAFVGANGIAIHVGDNLVNSRNGREVVAEVTAHEIGHNLGLSHTGERNNLLASSGGGDDLNQSQIDRILRSNLSQPVGQATSRSLTSPNGTFSASSDNSGFETSGLSASLADDGMIVFDEFGHSHAGHDHSGHDHSGHDHSGHNHDDNCLCPACTQA